MTDEEKLRYHPIIVDTWRLFIKQRKSKLYSDAWWEEIIKDYEDYCKGHKGTDLYDICSELTMVFLNEYERRGKRHVDR